jgi:hypothetical protein
MKDRLYQIRVTDSLLDQLGSKAEDIDRSRLGRGGGRKEITRADLVLAAVAETWGIKLPELENKLGVSPAVFIGQAGGIIRAARFSRINREFSKPSLRIIEGGAAA